MFKTQRRLCIKIIAVPPGFAHEEIRRAWVGIVIPLARVADLEKSPASGLRLGTANLSVYVVRREEAVKALRKMGKTVAARYWSSLPAGEYLEFRKDVCELTD